MPPDLLPYVRTEHTEGGLARLVIVGPARGRDGRANAKLKRVGLQQEKAGGRAGQGRGGSRSGVETVSVESTPVERSSRPPFLQASPRITCGRGFEGRCCSAPGPPPPPAGGAASPRTPLARPSTLLQGRGERECEEGFSLSGGWNTAAASASQAGAGTHPPLLPPPSAPPASAAAAAAPGPLQRLTTVRRVPSSWCPGRVVLPTGTTTQASVPSAAHMSAAVRASAAARRRSSVSSGTAEHQRDCVWMDGPGAQE